jgi:hypothetical protein
VSSLSPAELEQEIEWRRCKGAAPTDWEACAYFLSEYYKILHPERGRIRFDLRDAQLDTLQRVVENRLCIILKARQIGFTTLFMGYCFWLAFFWPDKQLIVLSKRESDAKSALKRCVAGYNHLPPWMRERGPRRTNDNTQEMEFDNDSIIRSFPSNNNPARGETAYQVIFDEFAFLEDQQEAWAAVEPTTDIGGRAILLSTANGAGDLYESMWWAADSGDSNMHPIFFPWSAVPERNEAWYEAKLTSFTKQNAEWIMHQEYPTSPREAFVRSGRSVFDIDLIESKRAAIDAGDVPQVRAGILWPDGPEGFEGRAFKWREQVDGDFMVWALPERGHRYVMGVDVAEGLEHGDFSVVKVIDSNTKEIVASWRGHTDPDLLAKDIVWPMAWFYRGAFVGIEVNNHGLTTVIKLRDMHYPRIYRKTDYGTNKGHVTGARLGYYTSAASKPLMIDEFTEAFREDLEVYDRPLLNEMLTYVRDEKGKMGGSPHDDQVMAAAVAVQMLKHMHQVEWHADDDDYMTFGWLMRVTAEPDEGRRHKVGARATRNW